MAGGGGASVRPANQGTLLDRKTHKPTRYLFQYRNELMGEKFLNGSVIPLLCKLAGVSQTDVVGRITSHRARATTATWMHKMGMAPADIGKLLGTYRSPPIAAVVLERR